MACSARVAFTSPCGVVTPRRSRCSQCPRAPQMELSLTTVADVALVAGVVVTGAVVLQTSLAKRNSKEDPVASTDGGAMDNTRGGIIGLSVLSQSEPQVGQGLSSGTSSTISPTSVDSPQPKPMPRLDEFELDVYDNPTARKVSQRLEEELKWAAGQVLDCGAGGVVVYDQEGEVLWRDGPLAHEPALTDGQVDAGEIVGRVRQSREPVVFDCSPGAPQVPSGLDRSVQNVAVVPVGDQGAVLVVASDQPGFYSALQDRIVTAVCNRLAMFVFVEVFRKV